MEAFKLKASIETFLTQYADSKYIVLSPQNRKSDAQNIFDMPQVTVFYSEGSFDKSKSSINSPYHHDCNFNIWVAVAAKSTVNLSVLQNPNATTAQYAAALADAGNASQITDEKADKLLGFLFDIIMRPENRKLGTDYITNRWITRISKNQPASMGAIVTITASISLTASCVEEVGSEEGIPGTGGVDTIVDLLDESKQGVIT